MIKFLLPPGGRRYDRSDLPNDASARLWEVVPAHFDEDCLIYDFTYRVLGGGTTAPTGVQMHVEDVRTSERMTFNQGFDTTANYYPAHIFFGDNVAPGVDLLPIIVPAGSRLIITNTGGTADKAVQVGIMALLYPGGRLHPER